MLVTPDELAAVSPTPISLVRLAFLVKVGAVAEPLKLSRGPGLKIDFLFDGAHAVELCSALGFPPPVSDVHAKGAYSESARAVLEWRPWTEKEVDSNVGPDLDVEDLQGRPSLFRRLWRWLTTFRLYRVSLSASERIRLLATQTIAGVQVRGWVVSIVAPRLRRLTDTPHDQCLLEYIRRFEKIGWGRFDEELSLAEKFLEIDASLKTVLIDTALARIAAVEADYYRLANQVFAYLDAHDPDGLLAKRVVGSAAYDPVVGILSAAHARAKRRFDAFLPGKNDVEGVVRRVLTTASTRFKEPPQPTSGAGSAN